MRRLASIVCAVAGMLVLSPSALAAPPASATGLAGGAQPIEGHASGTVISVARGSFAIEAGAGRTSVVNALTDAANLVTEGDFPYVYGGGHAEAGIASIGIKGPGYNGRRIGFDCSGSVAAVLAAAGVWQPTSGVPSDAGIIAQLLSEHLIARGAGQGASEVTLYDDPGVHIFMNIDGRFFGTSDGGGGGNPAGGAGWLDDGAPDATSHVFKRYHLLLPVIQQQTTFERILTFSTSGHASVTHGIELGSDVHVGYTQTPTGRMTADGIS